MKTIRKHRLNSLIALSLLTLPLSARTWTSSDESKTFEGEFKKFDSESKEVTIIRDNGRSITFTLDKLSTADQTWVTENSTKEATPANLEAELAEQTVGNGLQKYLTKLDGKKLKKAELEIAPEYYLLYYSASW